MNISPEMLIFIIDVEYWKTPSRKLYVARKCEYESIIKVKARKKLRLNRKKISYSEGSFSEEEDSSLMRLETKLAKVCSLCYVIMRQKKCQGRHGKTI